jgi:hypothetical protein
MLQIRGHILSARFEMENKKTSRTPKKKYFRSLVDRGPPQRRKIRMENKKKIEKTKKTKKTKKIRSLVDRGHPQRVLEYCFFLFSRCFFFGFLRVFLVFSKGPSPKSLGILFFFVFSNIFVNFLPEALPR